MTARYHLLWIGVLVIAIALRWLLPSNRGLSIPFGRYGRYVGANLVAFWVGLAVAFAIALLVLLRLGKHTR